MKLEDFDYHLPPELVAQYPAKRREDARMLVVLRPGGRPAFAHLPGAWPGTVPLARAEDGNRNPRVSYWEMHSGRAIVTITAPAGSAASPAPFRATAKFCPLPAAGGPRPF